MTEKQLVTVPKCFDEWYQAIKEKHGYSEKSAKHYALWKIAQTGFMHLLEDAYGEDIAYDTELYKWYFGGRNKDIALQAIYEGYTVEMVPKFEVGQTVYVTEDQPYSAALENGQEVTITTYDDATITNYESGDRLVCIVEDMGGRAWYLPEDKLTAEPPFIVNAVGTVIEVGKHYTITPTQSMETYFSKTVIKVSEVNQNGIAYTTQVPTVANRMVCGMGKYLTIVSEYVQNIVPATEAEIELYEAAAKVDELREQFSN